MNIPNESVENDSAEGQLGTARFVETQWSQILLARQGDATQAAKARERLCAIYWPPIYSFLRRKGHLWHDAEDLTQQFFIRLLEGDSFSNVDRNRGRFRSFLLGALKHFLIDEIRKSASQRRGGQVSFISIEVSEAEERGFEIADPSVTPEEAYDRRWAATVLDLAFKRLRADFVASDQLDRFEALKGYLTDDPDGGDYQRAGEQLGMTPKAVGVAVYRLRQRFRQLVRMEVADTLVDSTQVDQELADLFR